MRQLHELPAEVILDEFAVRGHAFVEADNKAERLEAIYEERKSATYLAIKKVEGGSVEDCKAKARIDEGVVRASEEWLKAKLEAAHAKIEYHNAMNAVEMWRSEQANRRKV